MLRSLSQWFARYFSSMPFGRRVMIFFAFLSILGCASPWFFEKMITYSGLNHLPIFGYPLTFFLFLVVYLGMREHFQKNTSALGIANAYWFLILLFLSLYTIILKTVVLYHLLIYSEDSQVLWGGMITFIFTGMSFLGLLFSWNYLPKLLEKEKPLTPSSPVSKDSLPLQPEPSFSSHHE